MANLNFIDKVNEATKDLTSLEQIIGKGLLEPFNGSNAGARKLMFSTHHDHVFPLIAAEKAEIETGYEIRYGDYSSSITKADKDYRVVAKISKFSFAPNHHYWLILEDTMNKELSMVERISYHPTTEQYGYLYNNTYMDSLNLGDIIPKDTWVQQSLAYDEYKNRKDGVNMITCYMALDDNMEDSIIFSDVAAGKLTSPLIKPVSIMINDNDIPLNIYGDDKTYKIIPDIGEDVKNANLISLRKEKKEESYYNQSVSRLATNIMSDETRQAKGKVIDINIYCNNPDILESHYYTQLKMYHDELLRSASELIQVILPYKSQGYTLDYDLAKLYDTMTMVKNNNQYMEKKPYSNIILDIVVLEELKMNAGDKASNRFGGKGVCSNIWPQKWMPRYKGIKGEYKYIDVIFNSSTMTNRENVGQVFELELTHISEEILKYIYNNKMDIKQAYEMIHKFISMCTKLYGDYFEYKCSMLNDDELAFFIESMIESESIQLSMKALSESMDIDKLDAIYKAFPFVEQNEVEVPMRDSEGNLRYVKARRRMVVGKEYIFRLKQFAEEKFSATSLSATNIINENTKSRAKKDYRELIPNTPIRFGNMETNNMLHLGVEVVISNMMIHSLSPLGRRLVEQMYTGDPYNIDIKLDSKSSNRAAEKANTYMKTIGQQLLFKKIKKQYEKMLIAPITFNKYPFEVPMREVPKDVPADYDPVKATKEREKLEKKKAKMDLETPIRFIGKKGFLNREV